MATDIDEAKACIDLAKKKNIPILTGYYRRYSPEVIASKEQIVQNEIGDLVSVHSNFWVYKPDNYYAVDWRTKKGAGPIQINLSHDIDLLLHFMGDVKSLSALSSHRTRGYEVEDSAVIMCEFASGALGTINLSDAIPSPWSWELSSSDNPAYPKTDQFYCMIGGVKGSLELPNNRIWYYQNEPNWYTPINTKTFLTPINDPLITQIEHFADVIAGDATPLVSGEDGLRVMKVIEAIQTSIAEKKMVYL